VSRASDHRQRGRKDYALSHHAIPLILVLNRPANVVSAARESQTVGGNGLI